MAAAKLVSPKRVIFYAAIAAMLGGCGGSASLTSAPIPAPSYAPGPAYIYVFNAAPSGGSIEVFAASATGNAAPLLTISGSLTGLKAPFYGTVDSNGTMYAPNTSAYSVTTYDAGTSGNSAPTTTIEGSKTTLGYPSGIAVTSSGTIYVANPQDQAPYTSVTVYAPGTSGDVAPIARIKGSQTRLEFPYNVGLDAAANIYVTNYDGHSGSGWITVYPNGTNGNVKPSRTIIGSNTRLNVPSGIAIDSTGRIYVTNRDPDSVRVYAAGAAGNVKPIRSIFGAHTGLSTPNGVAVDANGNIYVANEGTPSITIYATGARGDEAPMATISGPATGLGQPFGVALY